MQTYTQTPVLDILAAIALIIAGVMVIKFRDEIGSFTGYYSGRGGFVDKPTPGWMLIPFGLAFIIGGVVLFHRCLFG